MTTKVLLVNFGPDQVLVRMYPKDNEPGDNNMYFTGHDVVLPGGAKEFYVHSNQGLDLSEFDGKFAPVDSGGA